MTHRKWSATGLMIAAIVITATVVMAFGQTATPDAGVPKDLRPLLTPRHSEMKLVVTRYSEDRNLLASNYAGITNTGGRGGRGAAPAAPPIVMSTNRIARLKRFDMSWQTALGRIDNPKLSDDARKDLIDLKSVVQKNIAELDTQTAAIAEVMPLVPVLPDLVGLIEARIAIKDIDSEKAAGTLTSAAKQIAALQSQLTSGALRANSTQATVAATVVDQLRNNLANWNTFYNGYDPLFTWWVGLPYQHIDQTLASYSSMLREKIAPSNQTSNLTPVDLQVGPAPAPKFNEVPDLNEILSLT